MNRVALYLFLCIFFIAEFAQGQRYSIILTGGAANYQGDVNPDWFTLKQSGSHIGILLHYQYNDKFAFRAGISENNLQAADSKNPRTAYRLRNLSFESRVTELQTIAEYRPWTPDFFPVYPYLMAGVAVYKFDPFVLDDKGDRVYLQRYGTEGQGLPSMPDRRKYHLTQMSIPMGGGIRAKLSERVSLGMELAYRKLFTDYLDDVSLSYPDEGELYAFRGPKAVRYSYRGGELVNGDPFYPSVEPRGVSPQKDWWYTLSLTLKIKIGELERPSGLRRRWNPIDCPPVR